MSGESRQTADSVPRCDICGHALSIHNELGYCRVNKGRKGMCMCDSSSSCKKFFER